jgi:hypothetical protein
VKVRALAVVDTNVLLVANLQHPDISPEGVIACVEWLERIQKGGKIVVDDGYEILREYGNKTSPNTGNRVGDAFLRWLLENLGNSRQVSQVHIEGHPHRGYVEFPDDAELSEFDPADRKFVAVASAHPSRPLILQGSDAKWLNWSERLATHGIKVEFLCRADVERFNRRKRSR